MALTVCSSVHGLCSFGNFFVCRQHGCFLHFGGEIVPAEEEVELQQWAKTDPTYPRTSTLILAVGPTQGQRAGGEGGKYPLCMMAKAYTSHSVA